MSEPPVRIAGPLAAALAAAFLATGCGNGAAWTPFRPAGDYRAAGAGWVAQRTWQLPPAQGKLRADIAVRGRTETNENGVEYESLHVRLSVENRGEQAFTLTPAEVRLLDDEGHAVRGAEAYAGRNRTGTVTVAGGADATYELVFDLPPETRLAELGSVRLRWPYIYGDRKHTVTTKFLRIEEVYYYRPRHYHPYYDPWYDDYWYGPWPRSRFGWGYYHGW